MKLKNIIQLEQKHLFLYFFSLITTIFSRIFIFLNIILSGRLLDSFQHDVQAFKILSIYVIILSLVTLVISQVEIRAMNLLERKISESLIQNIINSFVYIEEFEYTNMEHKEISDQLRIDIEEISKYYSNEIFIPVFNVLTICISLIYISFINLKILYLTIFIILIFILKYYFYKRRVKKKTERFYNQISIFNVSFSDFFNYRNNIVRNSFQNKYLRNLNDYYSKYKKSQLALFSSIKLSVSLDDLILSTTKVIIMLFSIKDVTNGNTTIGDFIVLNSIFLNCVSSIREVMNFGNRKTTVNYSIDRVIKYTTNNKMCVIPKNNIKEIRSIKVCINKIDYYGKTILGNVANDFIIRQLTVVEGGNGTGKSTLARTILGLSPSTVDGFIEINGINTMYINMIDVRKNLISFSDDKFQEISSRYFNELYLNKSSFKIVPSLSFLLEGINYHNIDNLSYGQKKRCELYYLFEKDSDLIILDEPTIGIDKNTSSKLTSYLNRIKPNKIIIIITHDTEFKNNLLVDNIISM